MLRRLMLAALALCAFLALEGCGVNRLVAPQVTGDDKAAVLGKHDPVSVPRLPGGRRMAGHPTDGDGGGGGGPASNPNVQPEASGADTLWSDSDRQL